MQKLSPMESFIDSHSNYSSSQQISKHKGKNTPQWETQVIDFSQLKYYNFNLDITIDNSHVPVALPLLSLSLSYTDFSSLWSFFLLFFRSPFICLSLPFYNFNPYSYHYSCPVAWQSLMDIFFNFIGFLPSFLELWLLGVVCTV